MDKHLLAGLANLLLYPAQDFLPPESEALREKVRPFFEERQKKSLLERQEFYAQTFDFGKNSLYLTSYLYDDRERANALHKLKAIYEYCELEMRPGELPDFLPLMLEFLVNVDLAAVEKEIGAYFWHILRNGLRCLHEALREEQNIYGLVTAAIAELTLMERGK